MLSDILPPEIKSYDKNRPPKYFGQPTIVKKVPRCFYSTSLIQLIFCEQVYFHVTVLSIDTINEESMVINTPFKKLLLLLFYTD